MIWTDGGFTKFDVATLQTIQRVKLTPPPKEDNRNEDWAEEITLENVHGLRSHAKGASLAFN